MSHRVIRGFACMVVGGFMACGSDSSRPPDWERHTDDDTQSTDDTDAGSDSDTDVDSDSASDTNSETASCSDDGIVGCEANPASGCEDLCNNTRIPPELDHDPVNPCGCFSSHDACIDDCLGPDGLQDGVNPESTDGWSIETQLCVYEQSCHCEKHYEDCGFECPGC